MGPVDYFSSKERQVQILSFGEEKLSSIIPKMLSAVFSAAMAIMQSFSRRFHLELGCPEA